MARPTIINADDTSLSVATQMRSRPKTAENKRASSIARMSALKGLLEEPMSLKDVMAASRPDTAHQSIKNIANFRDVESMQ